MKPRIKKAETFPKDAKFVLCLMSDEKLYFRGLSDDLMKIARRYRKELKKDKGRAPLFIDAGNEKSPAYVLFVSLTNYGGKYSNDEAVKIAAAQAVDRVRSAGLNEISVLLDDGEASRLAPLVVEGIMLGAYRFDKYVDKKKRDKNKIKKFDIYCPGAQLREIKKATEKVAAVAECVNMAREIVNEPGDRMSPDLMARYAGRIAEKYKLKCVVFDEKRLKKEGYNGLLTVGGGSATPPRLIVLKYAPKKTRSDAHLCIIGKGVTFDTGGVCIKPGKGMWDMKTDMAGGGAVLHAVAAAAALKLPVKITAIVPAAENAVGPKAVLPGAVFRAKNGKTIHVDNTDAEGRLILTDAFGYAETIKPTHVIDLATLTGHMTIALGHSITGLFGDDPGFNRLFSGASEEVGEDCCEFPLYEEYREHLKCEFADVNNVGSMREGGAIHAALFLSEFKPPNASWIHLDIAGTAFADKKRRYFQAGATGVGVRALVRLAEKLSQN